MFYAIGFLLFLHIGSLKSEDCSFQDFGACIQDVTGLEGDFNVVSEENLKEVCNSKKQALECAADFIQNCMKKGTKDIYEATMGGKVKVVEDMCTEGTKINKGFVENIDCFSKIQEEIKFCNEKLKESQEKLNQAAMLDRLKVFYGCCVFGWHRNCLAKAARTKCNDEAAEFVHYVSTIRLGHVQNQICSSSYSSCHGLYGVQEETEKEWDEPEIEEVDYRSGARQFYANVLNVAILFALLFTKTAFFRQTYILNFFLYS